MTVEEYINKNSYFILNADTPMGNILREAMKEYAYLKCKELLEIVAEKATVIEYWNDWYVEKDSILNAVDLKQFIWQRDLK
jgi:hypothetical protein